MCVPSEGVVEGEGSKDVRIFFTPDHQSIAYSDRLLVDYNEKVREGVRSMTCELHVIPAVCM